MESKQYEELLAAVAGLSDVVYQTRDIVLRLSEGQAELRADVGVLKEDVSVLKEDVSVLKEDVSVLKEGQAKNKKKLKKLAAGQDQIRAVLSATSRIMVVEGQARREHEEFMSRRYGRVEARVEVLEEESRLEKLELKEPTLKSGAKQSSALGEG